MNFTNHAPTHIHTHNTSHAHTYALTHSLHDTHADLPYTLNKHLSPCPDRIQVLRRNEDELSVGLLGRQGHILEQIEGHGPTGGIHVDIKFIHHTEGGFHRFAEGQEEGQICIGTLSARQRLGVVDGRGSILLGPYVELQCAPFVLKFDVGLHPTVGHGSEGNGGVSGEDRNGTQASEHYEKRGAWWHGG